ncbi:5,10-methylene tetrahydromethanopterin reductase [Actinophytocola xinjiangensis]|uniref:5,10-methylene tetrahydromethanopterin reductase n=1 Tax=Actinophytocola xinjiangensis TaxID=485602 RepID=A0A7Z0WF54_9PSEU|nr:LLM class flavin-dependent oxidoreductase [Actinophytocola xinjiangensis]OLF05361.1 5,10-methylene tetrahydromethanopterin reductase [Actinophytocola xinjiangensis]
MSDYGHSLEFGVFLPPAAQTAGDALTLARLADRLGLDLVSVQDHPYQASFLDAWTLLSVIAAGTDSVRVFPNVVNLPLRPPAVLARSAASLDILSGGRVELGLGAGSFWDAIEGMGGPRRSPAESVAALEEAIAVIRALWAPGRRGVRLDGEHYRLAGAHPGPAPAHDIGIWLGAYKKRMLSMTGRLADGWLPSAPYAPPEQLAGMNQIIDDAALAAGRSTSDIRRLYNITGTFTGRGNDFLRGPAKVWIEQLAELTLADGVSSFILMVEPDSDDDLRRFAEEVAPGVRELVAQERALATAPPPSPSSIAPSSPSSPASVVEVGTSVPARVGVTPTPDPGVRLSPTQPWDETTRPAGPAADENAVYTDSGRASGQHLIQVHDHLRDELDRVRSLVSQVVDGRLDVGSARSEINEMTMRQNNWTLGAYCESYCRVVTVHHSIEDQSLFPQLRHADPRLGPVVDRLAEEHRVIHDVLNQVDTALVAMVAEPARIDELIAAVDLLTDTLLSHLSYEERSLVEPLARLPLGIA